MVYSASVPKPRLQPLTLTIVAFVLLALVEYRVGLLLPLERNLSDLFVCVQALKFAPDPDVVLVDIDDASLARMAKLADRWSWPRSVHGGALPADDQTNPPGTSVTVRNGGKS
jgi:adenylate cyclase